MKLIYLILFTFLIPQSAYADLDENRLETFLKECSNFKERKTYHLFPCELEAKKLKESIEEFEEKQASTDLQLNCKGEGTAPDVGLLPSFVQDIKSQMTCNEEDQKEIEKNCSKDFQCNKLRALNKAAAILPGYLEKKVKGYTSGQASSQNFGAACLSSDKSDCLTEIWTSFVANLYDTASSLWQLAKAGVSSIWNLRGFFNKKADDLHVASTQTKEDIARFWDSPAKWMSAKIDSLKSSVDNFIKQSVFCQKWEGKPHLSQCEQPLNDYACINCNDKTNAFCAATGVLSSELGLVFFTAGVGNMVSLVGKSGVKVAADLVAKVATKVKAVSPELRAMKGAKNTSRVARASGKASQLGKAFLSKLEKSKELISQVMESASKTMVGKAVAGVGRITAIPLHVLDEVSMMGLRSSDRLVASLGTKAMRGRAKRSLLVHMKPDRSFGKAHAIRAGIRKNARNNTRFNLLDERKGKRKKPSGEVSNSSGGDGGSRSNKGSERDRGEVSSGDSSKREREKDRSRDREDDDDNGRRRTSSAPSLADSFVARNSPLDEMGGLGRSKLGRTIVAADVAAKLATSGNGLSAEEVKTVKNEMEQTLERAQSGRIGASDLSNESGMKEVLGIGANQNINSVQARKKIETLSQMYSPENKEKVVSSLERGMGISKTEANSLFEKRRLEIEEAKQELYSGHKDRLNSMLASSKKQLKTLEQEIKNRKNAKTVSSFSPTNVQQRGLVSQDSFQEQNFSSSGGFTPSVASSPRTVASVESRGSNKEDEEGVVEVRNEDLSEDGEEKKEEELEKKKVVDLDEEKKEKKGDEPKRFKEKKLSYSILGELVSWLGTNTPKEKTVKGLWEKDSLVVNEKGEEIKTLVFTLNEKMVEVYQFPDGSTKGVLKENGKKTFLKEIDFSSFF